MKGYKTSKDYKRLKELLDGGHEVVATFNLHDHKMADVFRGFKSYYYLGWLGTFSKRRKQPFEDYCEAFNVEFFED